jgi:hypothetical protein
MCAVAGSAEHLHQLALATANEGIDRLNPLSRLGARDHPAEVRDFPFQTRNVVSPSHHELVFDQSQVPHHRRAFRFNGR